MCHSGTALRLAGMTVRRQARAIAGGLLEKIQPAELSGYPEKLRKPLCCFFIPYTRTLFKE